MSTTTNSGFFEALFDLSFKSFITARIIRVLYGLGILLLGIVCLVTLLGAFKQGAGSGLLMLIITPLLFLMGAMYLRVILEVLIVVFRIADNVERIANRGS